MSRPSPERMLSGVSAVKKGADPAEEYRKALGEGMILAAFTPREIDTLRSICRDSDNELGTRFLKAALDRAGAK